MMIIDGGYNVESYKVYKNRVVTKHLDKIKNQLRQIKNCSLRADDRDKLKKQLIKEIEGS